MPQPWPCRLQTKHVRKRRCKPPIFITSVSGSESTSQEQDWAREKGAKEMSWEKRLPEEGFRRVGMLGSLRGRRSEEMTQLNTSSPRRPEVPFESRVGDGN